MRIKRTPFIFASSTLLLVVLLGLGQPVRLVQAGGRKADQEVERAANRNGRASPTFIKAGAVQVFGQDNARTAGAVQVFGQDNATTAGAVQVFGQDNARTAGAVQVFGQDEATPVAVLEEDNKLAPEKVGVLSCNNPARIMPLGDSITYGSSSGVNETAQMVSYRKYLWDSLAGENYDLNFVGSLEAGWSFENDGFDPDHEGHPGWPDYQVASHIHGWLSDNPADVILVHIGTNELDPSPADVEEILKEIDRYSKDVTVILARIIDRSTHNPTVTTFNDNVTSMAQNRIDGGDKIVLVDMEDGAGIDYRLQPTGNMYDNLHPYQTGYKKMAQVWEEALLDLLPLCAVDDSVKVSEDSSQEHLDVLGNDRGTNLELLSAGQGSAGGMVSLNGNEIVYSPVPDFNGTETFTYTINQGPDGSDDTGTVTVTVKPVNDPPSAADDLFSVEEDGSANLDVLANDSTGPDEGETLTILSIGPGSHGGEMVNNGSDLHYTPARDFYGTETFAYTVNDGTKGGDATATVTIDVLPVNDPPSALDDLFNVEEDSPTNLDVLANDSTGPDEGETLTIVSISPGSQGGEMVNNGSDLDYTPAHDFYGTETFTYTVNDGTTGSDATATVTIDVLPVDDAPRLNPPPDQVNVEGEQVQLQVYASDPEGDSLSYEASGLPPGLSIDAASGLIHGELPINASGSYTVELVVIESTHKKQVTTTFEWTVKDSVKLLFLPVMKKRSG